MFLDSGDAMGGCLGLAAAFDGGPAAIGVHLNQGLAGERAIGVQQLGFVFLEFGEEVLLVGLDGLEFGGEQGKLGYGCLGLLDPKTEDPG